MTCIEPANANKSARRDLNWDGQSQSAEGSIQDDPARRDGCRRAAKDDFQGGPLLSFGGSPLG